MTKIKFMLIVIFLIVIAQLAFAITPKEIFTKKVKQALGEYKLSVSPKSEKTCSSGNLAYIGKDINDGLRLGHHIFLGPFSKQGDISESEDYCKINLKFKFTESSLIEITELSKCPKEAKKDEGKITKVLEINNNRITYKILESNTKCEYKKVELSKK